MMVIPCPHCGPRNEDEFVCWSEVVPRPTDPAALSDAEWSEYVYTHANPKGWVREQWWHEHGCRRWIVVERNTLTHASGWTATRRRATRSRGLDLAAGGW